MPLGWQPRKVSMGPQSMTYGLIGECDKFDTTMPMMSAPMLVADVVEYAARILEETDERFTADKGRGFSRVTANNAGAMKDFEPGLNPKANEEMIAGS